MGYYKVPQDIEAEDTILGPLTFKQMIFIIVAGVTGFAGFLLLQVSPFLLIPILPVFLVFLVLGVYRPKDQPVENKLAAYLGYYLKPRVKVWSRDGIIDHVTIKALKQVRKYYADDRTPDQVRSQLKQLAQVVDTRGWSTKQAQVQLPATTPMQQQDDDRLIAAPQAEQPDQEDVGSDADMFDMDNNPLAKKVGELTQEAAEKARAEAVEHMQQPDPPPKPAPTPDRTQTYPTQPAPTQTTIQPTKTTPVKKEQLEPLQPLQPGDNPRYSPYPAHMHQHVLRRDGTLVGADTSIDTPSAVPTKSTPATTENTETTKPTLDDDDKKELHNLADAGLNIEAIQRHGKEMEQEHAQDGTSGEMIIEH